MNLQRAGCRLMPKYVLALILTMSISMKAGAVFFDLDGEVTSCNPFACSLAGIGTGDPISGYIEVDDAAATPGATFTEADILLAHIIIGTLDNGPTMGPFGATSLTLNAAGEIGAGTAQFLTMVDTGVGIATVEIDVDAAAGVWTASTGFLGLGTVASGTIGFTRREDADNDGIADDVDNCTLLANPAQLDTNGDGFGNACDPDLDNNGVVNFLDASVFSGLFGPGSGDGDFNGDGNTNFLDYAIFPDFFGGPPGPSALAE